MDFETHPKGRWLSLYAALSGHSLRFVIVERSALYVAAFPALPSRSQFGEMGSGRFELGQVLAVELISVVVREITHPTHILFRLGKFADHATGSRSATR